MSAKTIEAKTHSPEPRRERKVVSYSGEVIWALELRRQIPPGGIGDGHHMPETPEEIELSERLTERMIELMRNPGLENFNDYFRGRILLMADQAVRGTITDKQYLKIHEVWSGKPIDAPESYIKKFGSANDSNRPVKFDQKIGWGVERKHGHGS